MKIILTQEQLDTIPKASILPSGLIVGVPIDLEDGRKEIAHPFEDIDIQYLISIGAEVVVEA